MHFSNETFTELMKIKENRRCFDCNIKSCQWASINNGIFLCTNCSGIHRGLGVDKSYIRSILWDNWTENQLEFMKQGGNKKLKEFLIDYPYDNKQVTPDKFYNSKIIVYYRKLLKSKVDKNKLDLLPPSKDEAFDVNENININKENNFSAYGSIGQVNFEEKKNDKNENGYNKTFQEGINTVKDFVGKAYEETKNAFVKLDLNNKFNNAKNALYDAGNKMMENKQISSLIGFFWKRNKENENDKEETNNDNINFDKEKNNSDGSTNNENNS